jgi:hypothetical protein
MGTGSVQAFQPVATVALSANAVIAQSATIVRTAPIFSGANKMITNLANVVPAANPYSIISEGENVLVYNDTTDVCFVAVGGTGTVADFTGFPVPPNGSRLIAFGPYCTIVSVISNSVNAGTIFVTVGNGTQY